MYISVVTCVNRAWMTEESIAMRKIFDTKSQDIVDACRDIFNCLPAESVIANRRYKFLRKISVSENKLCCLFAADAVKELLEIRQRLLFSLINYTLCNCYIFIYIIFFHIVYYCIFCRCYHVSWWIKIIINQCFHNTCNLSNSIVPELIVLQASVKPSAVRTMSPAYPYSFSAVACSCWVETVKSDQLGKYQQVPGFM